MRLVCRKEDSSIRRPNVHRKCSRISSSQIVREFEATPADKKMVNVTLTQPQIVCGRGETSLRRMYQNAENIPAPPPMAVQKTKVCSRGKEGIPNPRIAPVKAPKIVPIMPLKRSTGVSSVL